MTESSLFAQQGSPYADFKVPGSHYEGQITSLGQIQARKFKMENGKASGTGELEFWPDQKPKMVAIVTVQTTMRDPEIEGDDGQRSLWIKGKSMTDTVRGAIRSAGASKRGLEVGGYFSMTFTHETPNDWGGSPTKHYEVKYTPPAESPQDNINIVGGASTQGFTSQVAQQPAAAQATPAQVSVPGAGMMDVSNLPPEARAALQAMLAAQSGGQ